VGIVVVVEDMEQVAGVVDTDKVAVFVWEGIVVEVGVVGAMTEQHLSQSSEQVDLKRTINNNIQKTSVKEARHTNRVRVGVSWVNERMRTL
jgi:hypothetical protein